MIMYESHSVKKENESAETSLPEAAITQEPLIPDVTPVQERPTIQSQASYPPPPYFEPLPQLRPDYDRLNSAIYLTPMYSLQVGAQPTRLRCPHCSADILTKINYKSGCMTWSIAGSICAIGLFAPCAWLGCQCIPFCIDSCKDVQHSCSNCQKHIGTFDRMK